MTSHRIGPLAELPLNLGLATEIEGRPILVVRTDDGVFALDNLCPHSGARFNGAKAAKGKVVCPLHGARFDLETGLCRTSQLGVLPPIVRHETGVVDGMVEITLTAAPMAQPII